MLTHENMPISTLTTMRLGGRAKYVLEIQTRDDVVAAYDFAKERNLPTWIMGGGANTIGRDEGFDGAVLLNRITGIESLVKNDEHLVVRSMGGEIWDDLVEFATKQGYSGIEAMSLIPGTVGAAPVQNIGAYGQDVAQVIVDIEAYDAKTQKFVILKKPEMQLGYRTTRFNHGADKGRFFITAITIELNKQSLRPPFYNSLQAYLDEHNIHEYSPMTLRKAVCEIRDKKLPDPTKIASAGSFFKNVYINAEEVPKIIAKGIPVWQEPNGRGKINSGWLIEACGLKGKELYGFKVSNKASLVLINESAKSYAELAKARAEIVEAVKEKFGFVLEQEPVEMPSS